MKFKLDFQTEIDVLTQGELDESLSAANDAAARAFLAGIDWRQMPQLRGTASSGTLTLGVQDAAIGPREGYAWSIMRLAVSGLTGGSSPDTVTFYRDDNIPLWQLDGSMPFEKFSRLQLTLVGGQKLTVSSTGTFAATGQIVVSGELIEVPQVMLGKLA
ncbi:MAG: hypothetical protein ACYCO9_16380 [Streptosporangiaceae bacterium]